MGTVDSITVEISPGELLDRLTILVVKFRQLRQTHDETKVQALALSIHSLRRQWVAVLDEVEAADDLITLACCAEWLYTVHTRLWSFEDAVREDAVREAETADNEDYLLPRYQKITQYNDVRARIKRKVDLTLVQHSPNAEVKSHEFKGEINPDVFLGSVSPGTKNGICITV